MIRNRTRRKDFNKFPEVEIDNGAVLEETRQAEWMDRFRDWHVRTVFYFALLGMTDEQMAVAFGISTGMFSAWKRKHPTFLDALKRGKEQADANVVYSLYQSAIGYEHDSEQILSDRRREYDPHTGKLVREWTQALRVPIRKKYPPNVKAGIKWLETRQPEQWTQRKEVVATLNMKHTVDFSEFSLEELKVLNKLGVSSGVEDVSGQFLTTEQKQLGE